MARRRRTQLGGVRSAPMYMAEFVIGRGIGIPPGERFSSGAARCVAGTPVRKYATARGGVVPYAVVRKEFLKARAAQVGDASTGATLIPVQGAWQGGREPSVIGQVLFQESPREKTPRRFVRNMVKMCEVLACSLSQKEVLLRLRAPNGSSLLHRCSPTGAPKP